MVTLQTDTSKRLTGPIGGELLSNCDLGCSQNISVVHCNIKPSGG